MAVAMLAGIGLLAAAGQPLHAQSEIIGPVNPNVSVDLSVLGDGRVGFFSSRPIGRALDYNPSSLPSVSIPTLRTPISRLHIKLYNTGANARHMASGTFPKSRRPKMRSPKMREPIAAPKPIPIPAPVISDPVIKAPPPVAAIAPLPSPKSASVVAQRKPMPVPIAAPVSPPVNLKPIKAPSQQPTIVKPTPKPDPTFITQLTSKAKQKASIAPNGGDIKTGKALRVVFNPEEIRLPAKAKKGLLSVTNKLKGAVTLRLQLQAYAGSVSMSSSKARRVSLSRALSIRSYLIKSGIPSTRIDVRALGNKSTEKPINRVDVNIVER